MSAIHGNRRLPDLGSGCWLLPRLAKVETYEDWGGAHCAGPCGHPYWVGADAGIHLLRP